MKQTAKLSRFFCILLALILLSITLVSCGGESDSAVLENGANSDTAAGLDASAAAQQGKIIVTMTVYAYSDNFDEDYNALKEELVALGGYIANSNYEYNEYNGKKISATLKIPADKCQTFTDSFSAYLKITSAKVSSEDITAQYVDTESRIKALETELATMQKMFEEETDYNKALQISSHITDLITELEKTKSLLAEYEKRTAYSTINLTLTEAANEEEVEEEGFFKRIGNTFANSFLGVIEFFGDLTVFFIGNFPTLFTIGLIPFGIIMIVKLSKRKRAKKKRENPTPPQTPPPTYPPYYGQRPPMPPYNRPPMPPQTPPQTPPTPENATPSDGEKPE